MCVCLESSGPIALYTPAEERQGRLESLSVDIHHHLTRDVPILGNGLRLLDPTLCFLCSLNNLCGKQLSAKMRDETQERKARESEGGRRGSKTSAVCRDGDER